mmetsp:Transcript_2383/g.2331  ORF Transcript_2383/g.2331 Transcript_2383/m.2331 type:complete len:227 (-) Transcript_2383:53-733(-)
MEVWDGSPRSFVHGVGFGVGGEVDGGNELEGGGLEEGGGLLAFVFDGLLLLLLSESVLLEEHLVGGHRLIEELGVWLDEVWGRQVGNRGFEGSRALILEHLGVGLVFVLLGLLTGNDLVLRGLEEQIVPYPEVAEAPLAPNLVRIVGADDLHVILVGFGPLGRELLGPCLQVVSLLQSVVDQVRSKFLQISIPLLVLDIQQKLLDVHLIASQLIVLVIKDEGRLLV